MPIELKVIKSSQQDLFVVVEEYKITVKQPVQSDFVI